MSPHRFATASLLLVLAWGALGCSSEVRIGAVISESGAVGPYGSSVRRGMDLALEQVQATDFELGPVSVLYEDDRSLPSAGLQAATKLVEEDGVRVLIGAISSPVTLEIAPYAEAKRTILLSPASSAPAISDAGPYVFRNYPSDILEGTAMADFARDLDLKQVVVFALDNVWGNSLKDVFTRGFESRVREVVKTYSLKDGEMNGLDAMVEEVKELNPDGIYLVSYIEEEVELLDRLEQAALDATILSTSASVADVVKRAGTAAEYLIYPQPAFDVDSSDPAVERFVTAYRERYNEDPDIYAAHGYDALNLILEAMRRTQSDHPDDVKRGLLGIDDYEGAAGLTGFNEHGDVTRYPRIFVIHEGRPVPYEEFVEAGNELPVKRG